MLEMVSHFTHCNRVDKGLAGGLGFGLAAAAAWLRRRFRGTGSWGGEDFTRYTTTNATINMVRNNLPLTMTMVCFVLSLGSLFKMMLKCAFHPREGAVPVLHPDVKQFGRLWLGAQWICNTMGLRRWWEWQQPPSVCMLHQRGCCLAGRTCNQIHIRL